MWQRVRVVNATGSEELTRILAEAGHEVRTCLYAEAVLRTARALEAETVLVSPFLSGVGDVGVLMWTLRAEGFRVVLLAGNGTGAAERKAMEEALALGVYDILLNPVRPADLTECLRSPADFAGAVAKLGAAGTRAPLERVRQIFSELARRAAHAAQAGSPDERAPVPTAVLPEKAETPADEPEVPAREEAVPAGEPGTAARGEATSADEEARDEEGIPGPGSTEESEARPRALARAERLREARWLEAARPAVVPARTVFVGALPRCGTTTAAVGWALSLAEAGYEVTLVDGNPERPAVTAVLGGPVASVGWESPSERVRLARAPWFLVERPSLHVVPCGWDPLRRSRDPDALAKALEEAVATARGHVVVDAGSFPPLLPGEGLADPRLAWAVREAELLALVVPHDPLGLEAAARCLTAIRGTGGSRRLRLLLTGHRPELGTPDEVLGALRSMSAAEVEGLDVIRTEPEAALRLGVAPTPVRVWPLARAEVARR